MPVVIANIKTQKYLFVFQCFIALTLLPPVQVNAQGSFVANDSISIVPGPQYERGKLHRFLFGKHYRADWNTQIIVPNLYLDTLAGGVIPYQAGGGRQSKTLRLRNKAGKEYVLRSVDKTYGKAMPDVYRGSFVEKLMDDQVSTAQPFASVVIPGLAKAAGIHHATPIIGYVPRQPALGNFNEEFGNQLYLFEQRPDEDWEDADNFGNSDDIEGTEKVLAKMLDDNDHMPNQRAYIRSRIFDMLIGDWGRHEDQWRWSKAKKNGKTIYTAVPRDRDQAFTKFDGLVLRFAAMDHHQTFAGKIKDVDEFNFAARDLDRRMANEMTLADWTAEAKSIQAAITDAEIDANVKKLPPEMYALSGPDIASKLKKRRDHLHEYTETYYRFLAEEVDIPGSTKREKFVVTRLNNGETSVDVFKVTKTGKVAEQPYYRRTFRRSETKEVRLYGIAGNDVYKVDGSANKGIKVRIIGGTDVDSISDQSFVAGSTQKTIVYDNPGNVIKPSQETKLKLSHDTAINAYQYQFYKYDKRGLQPILFYNNVDRFHVGLGYKIKENKWRKTPAYDQRFLARYSISQNAIGLTYKGLFFEFPGKWNLEVIADYDAIRWTNFFGLGNETVRQIDDRNYYRMRNSEILLSAGLLRKTDRHELRITPFVQAIRVIHDQERYLDRTFVPNKLRLYERHFYAGGAVNYAYAHVNDMVVPTKGVGFFGGISYTHNLEHTERSFIRYNAGTQLYIPLVRNLSLAVIGGAMTITGDPEFYQYPSIGGSRTFRGFRRDRFRGNTAVYNNNELQWIKDVRTKIMNGKAGLVAIMDNGRVWYAGEQSDKWHFSYGGGFVLAPFNIAKITTAYVMSSDGGRFSLRITRDISPF